MAKGKLNPAISAAWRCDALTVLTVIQFPQSIYLSVFDASTGSAQVCVNTSASSAQVGMCHNNQTGLSLRMKRSEMKQSLSLFLSLPDESGFTTIRL
jgi:hypothetical protein